MLRIHADSITGYVINTKYQSSATQVAAVLKAISQPRMVASGVFQVFNMYTEMYSDSTNSVDFMHMDAVVKLHEEDMDVVVQPAVGWVDLNKKLAGSGLFFPVDPSPSAKIGGMVRVI